MTDNGSKSQGIKAVLEQIDSEVLQIQKELTENQLKVVGLKNQKSRLQSVLNSKAQQTERNLKLDLEAFQMKIRASFNAHTNLIKMIDKRLNDISDSQVQLAENMLNITEKVQQMQQMIG